MKKKYFKEEADKEVRDGKKVAQEGADKIVKEEVDQKEESPDSKFSREEIIEDLDMFIKVLTALEVKQLY